jgi:hypothetical protein
MLSEIATKEYSTQEIELVSFCYEFRSNRLTVSEEVRADDALWSDMHTQMSSHERTEL